MPEVERKPTIAEIKAKKNEAVQKANDAFNKVAAEASIKRDKAIQAANDEYKAAVKELGC